MPPKRLLLKRRSSAEEWYDPLSIKKISSTKIGGPQYLWTDVLSPSSLKEVAVHHEKIRELSEKISSIKSHGKGIMLLTGPPGSCKSTCFLAVCRELELSNAIFRYGNEDASSGPDEVDSFEEFLFRTARYTNICSNSTNSEADLNDTRKMRVVLIENLPMGICDQVSRFHSQLRSFNSSVIFPTLLVFILTKSNSPTSAISSTSEFDSATLNRLFSPDIKDELSILQVDFNPIAPLILTRALNRIIKLAEAQYKLLSPSRTFVKKLVASTSGDLRLAINNLQFMMIESKKKSSSDQKFNPILSLSNSESEFHERDSSILLFHALGKILHGKRLESTVANDSLLPDYLKHWRRSPLSFVPECVLDQCGLSGEDILAWIHENFTQFFTDLSSLDWVISSISFADSQLTGGMNWRLGLSPAADRNSETTTSHSDSRNSPASAGDNYSAMFVSRAVLLVPRIHLPGAGPGFKALRAPKSRNSLGQIINFQRLLSHFYSSRQAESTLLSSQMLRSAICCFRQSVLERLPLELKILNPEYEKRASTDELYSLCTFNSRFPSGKTFPSKLHPFQAPHRNIDECPMSFYCSPDEATEGAAVNIDEDSNDSDQHL